MDGASMCHIRLVVVNKTEGLLGTGQPADKPMGLFGVVGECDWCSIDHRTTGKINYMGASGCEKTVEFDDAGPVYGKDGDGCIRQLCEEATVSQGHCTMASAFGT